MSEPKLVPLQLVAAVARNGAIGLDNRMPWHLPEDLRHFKRLTWGESVLMGRRTFESLGKPLPGRHNLVLSRDASATALPNATGLAAGPAKPPGLSMVRSLDEARQWVHASGGHLFVIGGAQVYALALPLASDLWLTEIEHDFEGDTFFPDWDRSAFELQHQSSHTSSHGWTYHFSHYRRRSGVSGSPSRASRART